MLAEQSVSCVYRMVGSHPTLELHMSIQVEIPGEAGVDVATYLFFEPKLPEYLQEALHQSLYDGVHGGVAATALPLSPGGLIVRIMQLRLLPLPETAPAEEEIQVLRYPA